MDFRVLGPVEVREGDHEVPLGPGRQRALLARLLLEAGRSVSASRLIDDLWGQAVPPTAQKMVQVYVSQLRKLLGARRLLTRGAGYAVAVDPPDRLDLQVFERLRDEGTRAAAAGDPERAAARLREALALWRGAPLAEFAEPFAALEAARLEEARLACLEDRIDADLALGRHAELPGELEALIAEHPMRERLIGQLMLALYRGGRQAEALACFHDHRLRLDEALGIAPSPALRELELQILQQDARLDPGRRERPATQIGSAGRTIRHATTRDGVRLAYATHGTGPTLVRAATWLTDLELDWQSPVWRHWLEGLGEHHTVLRYDERGCGQSGRDLGDPTLDQSVADLETIVDAAGLERFDLLGMSQGGPVAIAYTVRHPERVGRVVLYGAYARGRLHRGDPAQVREMAALTALVRRGWGSSDAGFRRLFTNLFLPDGTPEQMRWYDELQRRTTDAETAARLREARTDIDVTPLAPRVTRPVLVLHAADDRVVPASEGELIARLVPGAAYREIASRNHILLAGEHAWSVFLATVEDFLDPARSDEEVRDEAAVVARQLEAEVRRAVRG